MSWCWGTAPPPSVGELRRLLQWGAHAPCTRQGYAAPSTRADSRAYRISHLARRSPSVLRSDGIIGRHRYIGGMLMEKFYNRGWVDYVLLVLTLHRAPVAEASQ